MWGPLLWVSGAVSSPQDALTWSGRSYNVPSGGPPRGGGMQGNQGGGVQTQMKMPKFRSQVWHSHIHQVVFQFPSVGPSHTWFSLSGSVAPFAHYKHTSVCPSSCLGAHSPTLWSGQLWCWWQLPTLSEHFPGGRPYVWHISSSYVFLMLINPETEAYTMLSQ